MTGRPSAGAGLRHHVASGLAWATVARGVAVGLQILSTVVLTRLLTPADFGLMAIVWVFAGFAWLLGNLGLGVAIVQRPHLTEAHLATAFWFNAAFGVFLTLALGACADLIARGFGSPALAPLTWIIALNFTVQLSVVPMALLERAMRFRAVALIDTVAAVAGFVVSVTCALAGLGAASLAWGSVALTATQSVLAFAVTRWRPARRPTWACLRDLWSVGGWLTMGSLIGYWSMNSDTLLLGATQPKATVGYYNRAYSLVMLPVRDLGGVFTRVMVPALATMQHDDQRTRQAWLRAVGTMSFVLFPLIIGMAATSEQLVLTLWGPRWLETAPLLRLLALSSVPWVVMVACEWLLFARGEAKRFFALATVNTVVTVGLVLLGLRWGVTGVAAAMLVRTLVLLPIYLVASVGGVGISMGTLVRVLGKPLLASACMAAVVIPFAKISSPPFVTLTAQVVVGALVYLAIAVRYSPDELTQLRTFMRRGQSQAGGQLSLPTP